MDLEISRHHLTDRRPKRQLARRNNKLSVKKLPDVSHLIRLFDQWSETGRELDSDDISVVYEASVKVGSRVRLTRSDHRSFQV